MFEWKNKAPLYIYIYKRALSLSLSNPKMCRNAYLYMFNKCSILWGFYQISWDILKYWNEKLNIIFLVNRWLPTFHSWPDIALTSGECLFAVLMVKGNKFKKNIHTKWKTAESKVHNQCSILLCPKSNIKYVCAKR